jgi:low affinity Fe/Cu permease
MKELFRKISARISNAVGSAYAFLIALSVIIIWGVSGPMFGFSDTWQLVINTSTTIITFLMVFLIQNTQNRDSKGIHLKLDELIANTKGASNTFMDLDTLSDDDLNRLDEHFKNYHTTTLHNDPVLHILHDKIKAEKDRRHTLRSAGHVIGKVLKTPLDLAESIDPRHRDKK